MWNNLKKLDIVNTLLLSSTFCQSKVDFTLKTHPHIGPIFISIY